MSWLQLAWCVGLFAPVPAPVPAPVSAHVALTLNEAVQLAVARSPSLRAEREQVTISEAQIDQAWGTVYPRVDASLSYQRNLYSADPFAGSGAGDLFSGLGAMSWLAFNEGARTDGDPTTNPLSIQDFMARQRAGLDRAGITLDDDVSFTVENQARATLSVTQVLYSGAAFAAIEGAEALKRLRKAGVQTAARALVGDVTRAWYGALLAQAQVAVLEKRVVRAKQTALEVTRRVERDVLPKFQQLSAEVALANVETALVTARNGAAGAEDMLALLIGLPVDAPLTLRGVLEVVKAETPARLDEALQLAKDRRPDLAQLRHNLDVLKIARRIDHADNLPVASAFANLSYVGSVPDDRTSVVSDPADPFRFSESEAGIFADEYWSPSLAVGVQLTWNLFSGFGTQAKDREHRASIRQLEARYDGALDGVRAEIARALRGLRTAQTSLGSQAKNVSTAELAYRHGEARVREGVSTAMALREASQQLDDARLNQLRARYDWLVARTSYEVAVGTPPGEMHFLEAHSSEPDASEPDSSEPDSSEPDSSEPDENTETNR